MIRTADIYETAMVDRMFRTLQTSNSCTKSTGVYGVSEQLEKEGEIYETTGDSPQDIGYLGPVFLKLKKFKSSWGADVIS
jgi:hypothetical protein